MQERAQAELRAAYSQALAALRSGRAASAERQLRDIQAKAPGDVNSLRLLGVALLDQDKIPAAVEILERVAAAAPQFLPARTDLARAYRSAGRLPEAREELQRVIAAAPTLQAAWLAYGDVLVDLEKYADARLAYERARLTDPLCAPHRGGDRRPGGRGPQDGRAHLSRHIKDGSQPCGGGVRSGGNLADRQPRRRCRAPAAACPQAVSPPAAGVARPVPGHGRARAASRGRGRDSPSFEDRAGKPEELGVIGNGVHPSHAPG